MNNYIYQNTLIGKKQLRQLLAWSFTNYDSMQACYLADELKYLGFKYATESGISISLEDLKVPFIKNLMLEKANKEIINAEKVYLKGKITDIERFQKLIDTWNLTSESLKEQIIYFFKNYDPLNSVYIMAFSGARGNLSQVRQLVGMRGLMADPNGEIMNLPIKKNFREGLTVTDYLMSGYGARKGIVDTALKTANSGYLTRRLIDVAQDILIREKDCLTPYSFINKNIKENSEKLIGCVLNKPILDLQDGSILAKVTTQLTPELIKRLEEKKSITTFYTRSPLTCNLYRAICQKCYGWDLANENLVDIGEAIGILAGQSIGEPGTQLTMRTFHTGGIFTSRVRQQILSPLNGIIQYSKSLETVNLRTNRGEEVLVTRNSGSFVLISDKVTTKLIKIDVVRNTILFPKNNQYVLKDTVLGEVINTNQQIRTEIKPIISNESGEIIIPKLKKNVNLVNKNKLIWLLAGQLYNSPKNSFLNFYPDYKLNSHSYIFRTKIINHYSSYISYLNLKSSLFQRTIRIQSTKYSLKNSRLYKFYSRLNVDINNYILAIGKFKYKVQIEKYENKYYLLLTRNNSIGILLTNRFRTLTGGKVFYNYRTRIQTSEQNRNINYYEKIERKRSPIISHKSIIWLGEEIHNIQCEQNKLLVEHGDVISKGFELIPDLFSHTSGLVFIQQKNQLVETISIVPGLVYEGQNFKTFNEKFYYPGELIFSNIVAKTLSFCEQVLGKKNHQLLIRPIELYELPYSLSLPHNFTLNIKDPFLIKPKLFNLYRSNQIIQSIKSLNLVLNLLEFKNNKLSKKNLTLQLEKTLVAKSIEFKIEQNLILPNYIPSKLRCKEISSCFLLQPKQFISQYTTLGYLESITKDPLEIVKFKVKKHDSKQILLISNNDCLIIPKKLLKKKKLEDFLINTKKVNQSGKIIIQNKQFFTVQKGRPYFFPNCTKDKSIVNVNLQYKFVPTSRIQNQLFTKRKISLNYKNILEFSIDNNNQFLSNKSSIKMKLAKFFLKKNGKLYSCLMPQFFKKLSFDSNKSNIEFTSLIQPINKQKFIFSQQALLVQNSELVKNKYNALCASNYNLTLLKFVEHPFTKSTKAIGLHAITDDYIEQEMNSVFCKNNEFIEIGKTLGLLKLEKEITGDIVQGLPRIEEILEARKKNLFMKRVAISQRKGLLIQKTSLDSIFEYRKLGTPIKENDKINPHKLLKVYFNYYGLLKSFLYEQTKTIKYNRLLNNYEGSYKSFKKVQSFILNSVQAVYKSQGVTINDKHLEVIIKQMTTKVLITYEGNTPLLRREVIDLYHIKYINNIIISEQKQIAYYIPFLLGITKAALNNPSFISAASFQTTTKVLTQAAIEGQIDWLRGLKENIIIGHLIPAGTGSKTYRKCFKKPSKQTTSFNSEFLLNI